MKLVQSREVPALRQVSGTKRDSSLHVAEETPRLFTIYQTKRRSIVNRDVSHYSSVKIVINCLPFY